MKHEDIRAELSELRDGALAPARRDELVRHVEGCASCRDELRDWERLSSAFLRRPAAPTPAETDRFVRSVMARLPGAAAQPARAPLWDLLTAGSWLTPALGLASAALLLSFLPLGRAAAAAQAPVFVADGHEVALSPAAPSGAGVGEAVGLPDESR